MLLRLFALAGLVCFGAAPAAAEPPKLLLVISVDQFRYDYLQRFQDDYSGGLARLLEEGAVFTNAHLEHFPSFTAVGHATILSGATPAIHGIVGNAWFDRQTRQEVTSVSDSTVKLLGAPGEMAASPHNLLVSTIADELKMAGRESKAIAISLKDRAAILTVGHQADAAYWFDSSTGSFVTSTYYYNEIPQWVSDFNASGAAGRFAGSVWNEPGGAALLELPGTPGGRYYGMLRLTPWGNDLVVELAKQAVKTEDLGAGPGTDVLALCLSANDYAGHRWGPDSDHVKSISIATDRLLGDFLDSLDSSVGLENTLIVFTADHGVAPDPDRLSQTRMPAGRLDEKSFLTKIDAHLDDWFGPGDWIVGRNALFPYLDHELARQHRADLGEVRRQAARIARDQPHILRVYTYDELLAGIPASDHIDRRIVRGFHQQRGADLFVVPEPYWLFLTEGATHGTPHHYDTHIPLIFAGAGVKPARYNRDVALNDVAPTLATLLDVATPSGSAGHVLREILQPK